MSLIACGECGKEISDKANACPHCGAPLRIMPVVPVSPPPRTSGCAWAFLVLLGLPFLFVVGNCSKRAAERGPAPAQSAPTAAQVQQASSRLAKCTDVVLEAKKLDVIEKIEVRNGLARVYVGTTWHSLPFDEKKTMAGVVNCYLLNGQPREGAYKIHDGMTGREIGEYTFGRLTLD